MDNKNELICPFTGEECSDYGSGFCENECADNPSNSEDDED